MFSVDPNQKELICYPPSGSFAHQIWNLLSVPAGVRVTLPYELLLNIIQQLPREPSFFYKLRLIDKTFFNATLTIYFQSVGQKLLQVTIKKVVQQNALKPPYIVHPRMEWLVNNCPTTDLAFLVDLFKEAFITNDLQTVQAPYLLN